MDNVEVTASATTAATGASGSNGKSGVVVWTNSMSTMMLGFLADLVASGARNSSGFKSVHHNQCAQALNGHFKLSLTGDQCSNHLNKWRKMWGRIVHLKNLSGALWDEDTCTIRLSDENYASHCNVRLLHDLLQILSPIYDDHLHYLCLIYATHLGYFGRLSKLMLPI